MLHMVSKKFVLVAIFTMKTMPVVSPSVLYLMVVTAAGQQSCCGPVPWQSPVETFQPSKRKIKCMERITNH